MRCLWLSWLDPSPLRDGQQIYSLGLLRALAAAGARIDVLCLANPDAAGAAPAVPGVRWWRVEETPRPAWSGLISTLPNVAHRAGTPGMRRRFQQLLEAESWDAVIVDGFYGGWALRPFLQRYGGRRRRPRLVYLSHNHEESMRLGMADNYAGDPLRRRLLQRDAAKARRLERGMVDAADVVTSITEQDAERYAARRPRQRYVVLTPGYSGRRIERKRIGPEVPRRAVLVGSFAFTAKKMNLREFLEVADPLFERAGVELQVIGGGDGPFLETMRRACRRAELVGPVDCIDAYLDAARVALVPERTGGGFKLKVLDYVFSRVPVAALEHSVAGTPLVADDSMMTYADHAQLAAGVLRAVDDLDRLNALQERAYAACRDRFDWSSRGQALMAGLVTA